MGDLSLLPCPCPGERWDQPPRALSTQGTPNCAYLRASSSSLLGRARAARFPMGNSLLERIQPIDKPAALARRSPAPPSRDNRRLSRLSSPEQLKAKQVTDTPSCSVTRGPWEAALGRFFSSAGGHGIPLRAIPAGAICPCGTGWRGLLGCSRGHFLRCGEKLLLHISAP